MSRLTVLLPFTLLALLAGCGGSEEQATVCNYGEPDDSIYMNVVVSGGAGCGEVRREIFFADEELPPSWDCESVPLERDPDRPALTASICTQDEKMVTFVVP